MDLGGNNHLCNFFSTECKCNLQGSKNNNCRPDSGKCECKDGYSGIHCELSIGENMYLLFINLRRQASAAAWVVKAAIDVD